VATDVRSVSAGARSGSGLTTIAVFILIFAVAASLAAPWIAPEGSLDPARLDLRDALRPPFWMAGGSLRNPLGSDDQGRDVVSTILYGSRISLAIGAASVALAATLGTGLGLWSGYRGGLAATLVMRMADVQLAIPGVLMALLLDGFARSALPPARRDELSMVVLVVAIGLAAWPQYARLARAAAAVECRKEHILAARLLHLSSCRIILRHILPNVLGPLLVVGTVGLGIAVGTEATLSFLGVGLPPTEPSLGTLIRTGSDLLLSGEWWVALCPAAVVVLIMLALNVVGDWLRDAIDQRAG
jgi:peptide/nickel transport system permease protein